MENQEQYELWHKDPKNWKFVVFYYNPEDNRTFPPKRIKSMGLTINFANTKSVVALVLFLAFVAWVVLFTNFNTQN
jgi:uncharacterized membrane protein